jgi:SAM-dependent methyltransferase
VAAVESGRLDLPMPGSGRTWERWTILADLAGEDLSLARLSEGHTDALAILAELGADPPPAGSRLGVWAAQPPGPRLTASRTRGGWRLDGIKPYCSGARSCTHALVTAVAPDGNRIFAISASALVPVAGSWPAVGMAGSDTLDVTFTDIPGEPVGGPGSYTGRPGFAHGGSGVAACWYGGARGVGQTLLTAAAKRDVGPHGAAAMTVGAGYFDDMYRAAADPWGFENRWYERRKRMISLAQLPAERYRAGFEPGCSIGVFTRMLASRCDALLSCDLTAAERTKDLPHVQVEQRDLPGGWPSRRFDLIVLSEILYYFGDSDLRQVLDHAVASLEPDGTLLAVHWRHPVAHYPRTGDDAHQALAARTELARLVSHSEPDFLAEVYIRTDADTIVPSGWLCRQLSYAGQGWDVVLGTVSVADWDEHPPYTPAVFAARYEFGAGPHPHVHGANLGIRASAYLVAGGFEPLRTAEDHALLAAAVKAGCHVVRASDITVETSARRQGRAPRGFSHVLRALAQQ